MLEKATKLTEDCEKISEKELIQRMHVAIDNFYTDYEKRKAFHFDKNSDSYTMFSIEM